MCVLSIKVPIRKMSGNLFHDTRIYIYIYIYNRHSRRSKRMRARQFGSKKVLLDSVCKRFIDSGEGFYRNSHISLIS